jgi:hypothetical protein
VLEPIREKAESSAVPVEDLDEVGLTAAEREQVARERVVQETSWTRVARPSMPLRISVTPQAM